ncbi:MAG: hypothetical protein AAGI51_10310 [Pseudomonadota bacterium]
MIRVLRLVRLIAWIAAPALGAAPLEGPARVVDGDTLRLGGERVRLEAIDAPERDRRCEDAVGRAYARGRAATEALRRLIRGRTVRCEGLGGDL